jgi:nucleoside-diphosphate-sugar epimerase
MRIASLRYHWVVEPALLSAEALDKRKGDKKDLWGYISESDTAAATLLALDAPRTTFPNGHEAFFIVSPTQHQRSRTELLLDEFYPKAERRWAWKGNEGLYDCSKAERMLGWKAQEFFPWYPAA